MWSSARWLVWRGGQRLGGICMGGARALIISPRTRGNKPTAPRGELGRTARRIWPAGGGGRLGSHWGRRVQGGRHRSESSRCQPLLPPPCGSVVYPLQRLHRGACDCPDQRRGRARVLHQDHTAALETVSAQTVHREILERVLAGAALAAEADLSGTCPSQRPRCRAEPLAVTPNCDRSAPVSAAPCVQAGKR